MGIREAINSRTGRRAMAWHLKQDHQLPADAVADIDRHGVDLREFHDEEHANDAALGLDGTDQ